MGDAMVQAAASPAPATAWLLRRAAAEDAEAVRALSAKPAVFRYLFDGAAPDLNQVRDWLMESAVFADRPGLGLWILARADAGCAGCVRLHPCNGPPTAELTYMLDPDHWGRGLATRMSWTVIREAFARGGIDRVLAGADLANSASRAVMRRLGMRFLREARYPLGAGVEYILRRGDPGPPRPIEPLVLT